MNLFLVVQAALSLGASIYEYLRGNMTLCIVYLAWAVSNGAMATVGGK